MTHRFSSKLFASLCGVAASSLLFVGVANAAVTQPGDVSNAPAAAAQKEVSPELQAAFDDFRNMKFEDATAKLDKIRESDKDMAPSQLILATWLAQITPPQPQAVRQAIEVAVTKHPNDPEAYVILAELNLQNSCVTEAEALFDKGATMNASFADSAKRKGEIQKRILIGQAQILALRGKRDEAIATLNNVLKLDEKNIGALNLLGLISFNAEDYDAAINAYTKAREIQPTLLLPQARVAMMCQQKGTDEGKSLAAKYMKEAIAADAKDPQVRIVAAQWSLTIGKAAQAAQQADYAIQILAQQKTAKPDDALTTGLYNEAKQLRGVIALFEKDYATAEKQFNEILAESPSNFAATNNLALALCEQADEAKQKKAVEYAQVNVDRFGQQQPEVFSTAAWVMHKMGKYQECAQLLQRYIQLTSGNMSSDVAYYLAANMEKLADNVSDAEQKANILKQAKEIITKTLENEAPFVMRPEAEALKARLDK
ncbi:MAG: tetratricopeptide repeat protein [Planctomycetia bacterium]|nr:tetratricopeptide repeat protein [Planctomycetia bacterium]